MTERTKKAAMSVTSLLLALLSVLVLSRYAASTDFHEKTIWTLDQKKVTVMELAAASTAASAAISLLPGDVGTPIADKLADLSSYFLLILCAIFLEKYLLTVTGYASFAVLIPLACVLFSINVYLDRPSWRYVAQRILIFALAIFLVIPASVKVSDLIEESYGASIQSTLDTAKQATDEMEDSAENAPADPISGIISQVKGGLSELMQKVQNVLNNFIEALAVLIVTSCIIPVLVLLFFVWLLKTVWGIPLPQLPKRKNPPPAQP